MKRREFIVKSAMAGAGTIATVNKIFSAPMILTSNKSISSTEMGELVFKPYFGQSGIGPHLGMVKSYDELGPTDWDFPSWAFTSDTEWDTFHSNIYSSNSGITVSDVQGKDKFGINVRWNVEGFGYIYMTANNGGEYYQLPPSGKSKEFNLNYELAISRIAMNKSRINKFRKEGWKPSNELEPYINLSEEFLEAANKTNSELIRAENSQKALYYAMWGGEKIEIEKAWFDISRNNYRDDFFIGCDTKGYSRGMDPDLFVELFSALFNYATITHYLPRFEKHENKYTYLDRNEQLRRLRQKSITVEGRPIFWADECCSPDWLINKSYSDLLKYVEKHTREVVNHYGDEMYAWEVINEAHDFGNVLKLTPDQLVEIAKLICEVAKDTNPKVHRLINNCCLQADYIQLWNPKELYKRSQLVTPHQFIKMCDEAGVDFTITGQQLYYAYTNRDLADTIRMTERLKKFGRPVQITEIGVTSGPTEETIKSGDYTLPNRPYDWHRHWEPELQAEWMEDIYTILYSKNWIEAINWYDFVDPYSFIQNGGLLANPNGKLKPAYHRLKDLRTKWEDASNKN